MKRILVTGAGGPAGSNFIKSLRNAPENFFVAGADVNPYHLELANSDIEYLLPRCDRPDYIDELNKIIHTEKIDMLHPQPDVEVSVISEKREEIDTLVYLPDKRTVQICQDKMEFITTMEQNNVPIAKSYLIKDRWDLESSLKKLLELNPDKAWLRAIKGAGGRASLPIKEIDHGVMWIDYWRKNRGLDWGDFMLAEYLPGKEYAFQSVWENGELITSQARERLEYLFGYLTPSGQTSSPTVAKTVQREEVNKVASDSVLGVDKDATGVFCVDLKENSRGDPCVTEINCGRFFTTSNFFSEAGVNMPYMYIKLAFGEKFVRPKKYNPIPEEIYWIRLMDMGHKLVREGKWTKNK